MKILIDENIPSMTASALEALGHDVMDIRGTNLEGASDGTVWAIAQQGGRLLVSTDKGFARRRSEEHFGLLIVRLRQPTRTRIPERVLAALPAIAESLWPGTLLMVRDTAKSVWRR